MFRLGLVRRSLHPSGVQLESCYKLNFSSTRPVRFHLGNALVTGVVAGVVGGGTLLVAGYTFYHLSGAKKAVDTFKPATFFLGQTHEKLVKHAPSQALGYLRQAAKSYVAFFPVAGFMVDRAFDAIGDVVDTHAEEANTIINKAYEDILEVVQKGGNEHKTSSALQIVSITQRLLKELTALGIKAGQPVSESLELEKHAGTVSAAAGALFQSARSNAPKAFDQLKDKAKDIFSSTSDKRATSETAPEGKRPGV